MEASLADRVTDEFARFMGRAFDSPHCLVHNDFGPANILVDPETSLPSGIIDFEDAWVGDPAVDFVPLVALFDADALDELRLGRDLGEGLAERMWFYRWMGSVHAVIYGVREGVEAERLDGLTELRRRLDAQP